MSDDHQRFEQLIQKGDLPAAETALFQWIQSHPNDAQAWLLYGQCLSNASQKQACFQRVLALDPGNAEAQELLRELRIKVSPPAAPPTAAKPTAAQPVIPTAPPSVYIPPPAPKAPGLSTQARSKLSFAAYTFFHILITLLVGAGLVLLFSAFIPGLLELELGRREPARTWLSNADISDVDPELQQLKQIFLNPSHLDYRKVSSYEQLRRFRASLTNETGEPASVEFTGVRFTGELTGGLVLQRRADGTPEVVLMEVLFDEKRIPVVYYGPAGSFHYGDQVLVQGVYIEDANGIAAQRVQCLNSSEAQASGSRPMAVLRVAGIVTLWSLLSISFLAWKLSLRRWRQAQSLAPAILTGVLLCSFLLSSCNIELSTSLRMDGTGITHVTARETRENMDFLRTSPGMTAYLSSLARDLRSSGAMFEQYVEGEQEVFVLQRYFNNSGGMQGNTYPIEGSWVSVQRYREGNQEVLRFMALVDTRALYQGPDQVGADVSSFLQEQLNQISMTYRLNIPGSLAYHNGTASGSQQVTWKLRMNAINILAAESRFTTAQTTATAFNELHILIGLGVVFVIACVIAFVALFLPARPRAKRRSL